jgi:hypothetical protein
MDTLPPKLIGIRLTANPRSDIWQVPAASAEFSVLLIGWITSETPIEAGVPLQAMQLLSECLTRLAVVTFLSEAAATARLAPNQWHEAACGWLAILTGRQTLPLFATRDSHVAQELFNSGYFSWNQQSQIALLTEPGHTPAIDYDLVEQCLNRSSIGQVLRDRRLLGILYPAVDGDFAALISSDLAFAEDFQTQLRLACETARLPFSTTSEEEFRRTPWTGTTAR